MKLLFRNRRSSPNTTTSERSATRVQAGMTMLEIMIVLAILALVMGLLVGPKVWNMFKAGEKDVARAQVKQMAFEAYQMWARDSDKDCPDKLDALLRFTNQKNIKDPWKQELIMVCGDNRGHGMPEGTSFGILSKGPDKKLGTKDDIKSWEIK